jgi:flagellar basal-body rod protein FlgB
MFSSIFQSSTIPMLEQVVNFTEERHGVLAGNIANLDTPGYKTRDLSPEMFEQRLKEAVDASHKPAANRYDGYGNYDGYDNYPSTPAFASTEPANQFDALKHVNDSMKSILRHDNDDVSMEHQINEMVKNETQHNMAIGIMTAQFRLLHAAISERGI